MRLYKKEQIYDFLKNTILSMIVAVLISVVAHVLVDKDKIRIDFLEIGLSSVKIFFSILPLVFLKQKNFIFKDGPLKATALVFYYLILVPIINFSLNINENESSLKYFFYFLSFINILLLIACHIIILKYVFADFFRRRRKVVPKDVVVVITTYITIAISFGLLYTVLSLFSSTPVFNGITQDLPQIEFYFKHIYFSFITITTVGYGDVYPLTMLAQFLVVVEIITGIVLTNVILGLVIGSGILSSKD
ncbi:MULTISPECIES: potassium channel family protein [Cetobacterium]|uniref:potassium channel family protein n=1 Tax=Cetobacterium TaxID=180162 RepID=UPI00163C2E95|nr:MULTISPECIES: potassium channel family protein [Cetobacterium]MBC2852593.1 two pore domain potassium channel family protein [Cetobacterium sp. 2G large]MCQ9626181.1 two pore domain potassium channel family protein [Cetobacterium somerae]